jgi:hypothetical protein
MKTTKHFALTTLLVVGATLYASTPAWAQIDLTPTGAEPKATGVAELGGRLILIDGGTEQNYRWVTYGGTLYVACAGLTPGATYSTTAGRFKALRDGTGTAKAKGSSLTYFYWLYTDNFAGAGPVEVYRINSDGSETLILYADYPH